MEIRKAKQPDLDQIERLYEQIHDEEEQGLTTIGWIRGVYPTKKTAEDALCREDLFVMTEGEKLVAAAIINQIQVPAYRDVVWRHNAADHAVMVLHCLTVDPLESGKGYGRAFVGFYENYAMWHHCCELRMDTNALNTRARRLYQKLGYEEIGIVECAFNGIQNVHLVCLEKQRTPL